VACVACGGGGDGDDAAGPASSATEQDGEAPSTSELDDGDDDGDDDGGGDDEIDSVQWGPDEPPIPGQYFAFAADRADGLACSSIDDRAEGDEFWTLAAQVCRVFTGEGDWPATVSVPPPPEGTNSYERCLDGELVDMLQQALAWRDDHPGEAPSVRYPAEGTHSPCQTKLYDVGVTDAADAGDCVNDETLDVPEPGIGVELAAPGITGFANPQASIDGGRLCVVADATDDALRSFVVVVPASLGGQTVTIDVESNYGTLRADVALPALDDGTTTSSEGTEDDDPTTSTSDETTTEDGEDETTTEPTASTEADDSGTETTDGS
jgi:hypothetical protein